MSRWFQFSLRGFLIAVTVFAVWFGSTVDRARKQRQAVNAIDAVGGDVMYGWEEELALWEDVEDWVLIPAEATISAPEWLRKSVGDDFFQDVTSVILPTGERDWSYMDARTGIGYSITHDNDWLPDKDRKIDALIANLRELPKLKAVYLGLNLPELGGAQIGVDVEQKMKQALPHCRIVRKDLQIGRLETPSATPVPPTLPATGFSEPSSARAEALELRGFEGLTPRPMK